MVQEAMVKDNCQRAMVYLNIAKCKSVKKSSGIHHIQSFYPYFQWVSIFLMQLHCFLIREF